MRTSASQAGSNGAVTNGEQSTSNSGYKTDAPPQTNNPESGNQAGAYNTKNPPNAAIEWNDDGILDSTPTLPEQGGREQETPDLSSRNRLNASGLGGV